MLFCATPFEKQTSDKSLAGASMDTLQPPDRISARVIEDYCALLDSPGARLRFMRRAVARCQAERAGTKPSRWPYLDGFRIRKIVLEELVPLVPAAAQLVPVALLLSLVGRGRGGFVVRQGWTVLP